MWVHLLLHTSRSRYDYDCRCLNLGLETGVKRFFDQRRATSCAISLVSA
jgi:hypothetical protein